jgi:hypothetical protein
MPLKMTFGKSQKAKLNIRSTLTQGSLTNRQGAGSLRIILVLGLATAVLAGCQTSSSSSSSSSMPSMPSTSSSSMPSSSPSMPSTSSSSSSGSPSFPTASSSSSSSRSSSASSSSSSSSSQSQPGQQSSQQGGQQSSQQSGQTASTSGGFESSPQSGTDGQSSGNTGFENAGSTGTDGSTAQNGTQAGSQSNGGSDQAGGQNSGGFDTAGNNNGGGQSNGSFEGSQTAGQGNGSGDDPFADLSDGRGQVMTASERRAALDARLDEGFAEFDGMILGERERVQAQADDAGSGVMSGGGSGTGNGGEVGQPGGPLVIASGPQTRGGGIIVPPTATGRQGDFETTQEESFPVPDDIPPDANDDVVARQLREAAMREPDPELREKLWDEYRAYTGIGQ